MMGSLNLTLAAISWPLLLLVLLHLSPSVAASAGAAAAAAAKASAQPESRPEWETLTKRNYSSQIRLHPNVLLMVTVPWSGESRSLMDEIKHLVAINGLEFGPLKLMIVYRNSEKMLADVLGAAEGISLFYYHHSTSYKYGGRLRAQNILSSVYHIMSLKHDEIPLKPLRTREELENFLQSTDKSVLLLDFCGWTAKLMQKSKDGAYESSSASNNKSLNAYITGEVNMESDGRPEVSIDEKVVENEELNFGAEAQVIGSPWEGGFALANQSVSQQIENREADTGMTCMMEEFKLFESFYTKFVALAREYFLPPERQRYGLVSERSLLPLLGIDSQEMWLLMVHFSGCPNCSILVKEGDRIRTVLQSHHPLVKELEVDGHNIDATFPANRPSIVLFVDRSSESSIVRGESKLSLEVLRKFARQNQLSYRMFEGLHNNSYEIPLRAPRGSSSKSKTGLDSLVPKIMKIRDNMAVMVVDNGERISVKNSDNDHQGNTLFDIVAQLLQQTKSAHTEKQTRISLLAKEVGFQLLSEDFEVRVVDSLRAYEGNGESEVVIEGAVTSLKDQTPAILGENFDNNMSTTDSDKKDTIDKTQDTDTDLISNILYETSAGFIRMKDNDLFDATDKTGVVEDKKSDVKDLEDNPHQIQEVPGNDDKLADTVGNEVREIEISDFESTKANEFQLGEELHNFEEDIKEDHVGSVEGNLDTPKEAAVNSISTSPSFSDEGLEEFRSTLVRNLDGLNNEFGPFLGSVFVIDAGYRLLRSLTARSGVPSLVILDPIFQEHYVFPEETEISYSSVVNFVDKFLNRSLSPYQRSASSITTTKEFPRPPFVNLDFHEAYAVPRVTANTFCELVIGIRACKFEKGVSSDSENFTSAWTNDILVLFSNSWCGFCQRMELVVREVYRAFKNYMTVSAVHAKNIDPLHFEDNSGEPLLSSPPIVYLMDCTLNDCSSFLRPMGKELYPTLVLYPAENKTGIFYEGDMSVINIMEFLESHGSNSHYLTKHKGFLWTHAREQNEERSNLHDASLTVQAHDYSEAGIAVEQDSSRLHYEREPIVVGSILTATDKLVNAVPFDNSTILIVSADPQDGFQGLIINKPLKWDIFKDQFNEIAPLKQAPLFYGGPVTLQSFPLVSMARKAFEGYVDVIQGVYFGNPVATSSVIRQIKLGDRSVDDFWFFLGYSGWAYDQLFDELNGGSWHLSNHPIEHLDWPES
uniref:Thioredoxin domain-containing protein n=1 Tax=Ananas comosus var. bracteatus TaxID=296719 RepID=A0A6V7PZX2_ANACO|nr:unnamed protein product [Ananas comosus var. bracteatus]